MTSEVNLSPQRTADADLVRQAQQGDVDAFATLFHANKTKIYSLCLRMTSNIAEAEDLTQEAFLMAFRKLGTFRGDSALSTWLYRVAVNTVLMHFRKRGLRQVSLAEFDNQNTGAPKREHGESDGRLVGTVDRITLARAIKVLPHGYRTVFLMHEVHGYEHQEIARILRCSVGNSKSQLHKAKTKMRELLSSRKTHAQAGDIRGGEINPPRRQARATAASSCEGGQPAWRIADETAA